MRPSKNPLCRRVLPHNPTRFDSSLVIVFSHCSLAQPSESNINSRCIGPTRSFRMICCCRLHEQSNLPLINHARALRHRLLLHDRDLESLTDTDSSGGQRVRDDATRFVVVLPVRVQIPIEAREGAARYVKANAAVESDDPARSNCSCSSARFIEIVCAIGMRRNCFTQLLRQVSAATKD